MSLRKEIIFDVQEIGLGQVKAKIEGTSQAFGEFNAKVDLNSIALKSNLSRLKSLSRSQKGQTALFNEYNKILNQVTQTTSRNRAQTDRLIETYRTTGELTNKQITEAKRLVESNYEIAQSEAVTMMATDRRYAGQVQANQAIRSATSGGRILAQVLEEVTGETHKAAGSSAKFSGALGGMSGNMARSSKSLASSNQLLFSFSDLVQDSTQFSQGFATGMRAIGNNIGFTMELFASVNNHVKEFNRLNKEAIATGRVQAKTVKGELGQSLKGFGGALLGVNAAVMVVTLALQAMEKRLDKIRERGKESAEVYKNVASAFAEASEGGLVPDPFGLRKSAAGLEMITKQFESLENPMQKAVEANDALISSGSLFSAAPGAYVGLKLLASVFPSLNEKLVQFEQNAAAAFGDESAERFVASLAAYEELAKEVEKARLEQEAYMNFLNQEGNETLLETVQNFDVYNQALRQLQAGTIDYTDAQVQLLGVIEHGSEESLSFIDADGVSRDVDSVLGNIINLTEVIAENQDGVENATLALKQYRQAYVAIQREVLATIEAQNRGVVLEERIRAIRAESLMLTAERTNRSADLKKAEIALAESAAESEKREAQQRLDRTKAQINADIALGRISPALGETQISIAEQVREAEIALATQREENAKRQATLNKVISDAGAVQSLAQTTALLGDIFGASKDMQIAMAVIDGGAAIVKTFAQLGFPAGIPAALAVAARTAQTIAQMKSTQPGDAAPIGGSGAGGSSAAAGISVRDVGGEMLTSTPYGQPSYSPVNNSSPSNMPINVYNSFDEEGIHTMVEVGKAQKQIKQVRV